MGSSGLPPLGPASLPARSSIFRSSSRPAATGGLLQLVVESGLLPPLGQPGSLQLPVPGRADAGGRHDLLQLRAAVRAAERAFGLVVEAALVHVDAGGGQGV